MLCVHSKCMGMMHHMLAQKEGFGDQERDHPCNGSVDYSTLACQKGSVDYSTLACQNGSVYYCTLACPVD